MNKAALNYHRTENALLYSNLFDCLYIFDEVYQSTCTQINQLGDIRDRNCAINLGINSSQYLHQTRGTIKVVEVDI